MNQWRLLILLLIYSVTTEASTVHLSLRTSYVLGNDPLTTETVWVLDSRQKNPHLQRWVVNRHAELLDLKASKNKDGTYGVDASQIIASAKGFVRGPGPWYRPWKEFPCGTKPVPWFGQIEGARIAASQAADLWVKALDQGMTQLEVLLSRIKTQTSAVALDRADQVFKDWIQDIEQKWRDHSELVARQEEWNYYIKQAEATGSNSSSFCENKKDVPAPSVTSMMEPITGEPTQVAQLLARAPVRLWNGLFSVRMNLTLAGKSLNGRFLVDTNARKSVISPSWLEGQGIYSAWVVLPHVAAEKVEWSGLWNSERPLARTVYAQAVELSGLSIPLHEFLLAETDFFSPPDNIGNCCDGVLGMDFLSLYPVEFKSSAPAELRVWPRTNFHWSKETPWIEVSETPSGQPVSSCSLYAGQVSLEGVNWDTGSEESLQVHSSWYSQSKKERNSKWNVSCGPLKVAEGLEPIFPKPPGGEGDRGILAEVSPAANLGMLVLSQSTFTLDLPHGRLWFGKEPLPLHEKRQNVTGLTLEYTLIHGERILKVASIEKGSLASKLIPLGIKPGTEITKLDLKNAEDIDLWEVNSRLAGDYGKEVILQWKSARGVHEVPFEVRE